MNRTARPAHPPSEASAPPPPPTVLLEREPSLRRISMLFARVPIVILYGPPGAGKTALISAFASRRMGLVGYARVNLGNLAAVVDDLRRQVSSEPLVELASDAARCRDLARRLDAARALWVLDDVHVLPPEDRNVLVNEVGRRLKFGRLLLTSRERMKAEPRGPDRGEVYLDPLSKPASQALWHELDELYGPVAGFETAWDRSGGNPLLLRRAHAAVYTEGEEPMEGWLDALTDDARFAAELLTITRIPLPESVLLDAMPGSRARDAVRELARHLVLDPSIDGALGIDAAARDIVRRRWGSEHERALHRRAAEALTGATLAPVVRAREVTHHLLEAGETLRAGQYLRQHERLMIEHGAVSEMLGWIESIPEESRPPTLTLLRGIGLTRLGFAERGYQCLHSLTSRSMQLLGVDFDLALAQAATLTGRPRVASQSLHAVLARPDVDERHRRRAVRSLEVVTAQMGRFDEARGLLDEHIAARCDGERCEVAFVRAFTYWLQGRYEQAEEPMREARALQEAGTRGWRRRRLYITFAPIEANLGRHDLAERTLREAMTGAPPDDELTPIGLQVERAVVAGEQGRRVEAIALLREVVRNDSERGLRLSVWWAQLQLGRNLLLCGRRGEGLAVLDEVQRAASDAGARALSEAARKERLLDPVVLLDAPSGEPSGPNVGLIIRRELLSALRSLRESDLGLARVVVDRVWPDVEARVGYGLDRAIACIVRAGLAQLEGDHDTATAHLAAAQCAAFSERVDAEVYESIVRHAGLGGPRATRASTVVLDAHEHALRFDDR
ncbi:MAG: tetratricopeptide repeat protein, partial [Myxococcota bacterium]